jgi:hypothetical protein
MAENFLEIRLIHVLFNAPQRVVFRKKAILQLLKINNRSGVCTTEAVRYSKV